MLVLNVRNLGTALGEGWRMRRRGAWGGPTLQDSEDDSSTDA